VILLRYDRIAARVAPKLLLLGGVTLIACSLLVLVAWPSFTGFLLSLVLLGGGTGLMEGAMTQCSLDWEQAARRRGMNMLHAGFSAGAVLGAVAAGALLGWGWNYPAVLIAVAVLCAAGIAFTVPVRFPPPTRDGETTNIPGWRDVLRTGIVRMLMIILLFSLVVESVAFLWSVIYLRTELAASVEIGGAGFALFNGAMFVGRILNVPLVARYGARSSLLVSGAGLVIAGVLLLAATSLPLALMGLAMLGLGVAGIFPTVVSAAGDMLPGKSEALSAVVMTSTYLGFVLTPPAVGWIAEASSLRAALVILLVSGLGILALAFKLGTVSAYSAEQKPANGAGAAAGVHGD
jgi:MFS family permease